MKKLAIVALSALALNSCSFFGITAIRGNGVAVETVLEVEEFSSVSLTTLVDVDYTIAPGGQSLVFTCDENLLEYYNIRVENGVLVLGLQPGVMGVSPKVKTVLVVKAPVLEGVKTSGSGDCDVHGAVAVSGEFCARSSGSGDITLSGPVNCGALIATTTGSGDIYAGSVQCGSDADIRSSGSGDIEIDGLVAATAQIRTTGSGDIEVDGLVASSAEIRTTGSGDIEVDGLTADTITAYATGSGDITLVCKDAGVIDATTSGSGDIYVSGTARNLNSRHFGSGRVYSGKLQLQ